MKVRKKMALWVLASALLFAIPLSTSFYVNAQMLLDEGSSGEINVSSTATGHFSVVIPKEINLVDTTFAEVNITASGDIPATQTLKLAVDNVVSLSSIGKNNVLGLVSLSKASFSSLELTSGGVSVMSVSVPEISAGIWSGSCNVYVNLENNSQGGGTEEHTHSYESVVTKEATCIETGLKTYSCACGDVYTEGIPAKGHIEVVSSVEASCTENGKVTVSCSACGAKIRESVIPATGHNYIITETNGSCTQGGIAHYECQNCEDAYDETLPVKEHTYTEGNYTVDVEKTCTTNGSKSIHCDVCGVKIEGTEVPILASGHSHGQGVITQEATCTTEGVKTFSCACGHTYTQPVKALGHAFNSDYTIDSLPTCTSIGFKSQHCSRCSERQNITAIPPQGHTAVDGVCTVCGATVAGLYDANGVLLASWETLYSYGFNVQANGSGLNPNSNSCNLYTVMSNHPELKSGTKLIIAEGVTRIGGYVFTQCDKLTCVAIPNSVTTIGQGAFFGCHSLSSVNIPNSVTTIEANAFYNCGALDLSVPSSVTTIGDYAFFNVPHISYSGSATGSPWGAESVN